MIARDVARRVLQDASTVLAEGIPDAPPPTVLVGRALDLVAQCGGAPHKIGWECDIIEGCDIIGAVTVTVTVAGSSVIAIRIESSKKYRGR